MSLINKQTTYTSSNVKDKVWNLRIPMKGNYSDNVIGYEKGMKKVSKKSSKKTSKKSLK